MTKGTATATFLFSDATASSTSWTCHASACTVTVVGYPNDAAREALSVAVSGPDVRVAFDDHAEVREAFDQQAARLGIASHLRRAAPRSRASSRWSSPAPCCSCAAGSAARRRSLAPCSRRS